jgi:ubiquinone/menaquinone biosynthesis C-methylase UbiE
MRNWIYDEFRHCGVDYSDVRQAEIYDEEHGKFRNYESEVRDLMRALPVKDSRDMILVDLGCGTGALAVHASTCFRRVIAVDVSPAMISIACRKAEALGISNVEFVRSGFLNYEHPDGTADVVITKAAFHHLPDFWKQVALLRINRMLKNGGIFYMFDVVFGFEPREYEKEVSEWISGFEHRAGERFRAEVETHVRDEFSTFRWILEGMIERAGFSI